MTGEDKFCLKWNDFQQNMSQSFLELRDALTDVTIYCSKERMEAHRLVLCSCSGVFKELLLENKIPNSSIILFDVEVEELNNLLEFMYKGEVSVSQDRLQRFLDIAEKLEVKGLCQKDKSHRRHSVENQGFPHIPTINEMSLPSTQTQCKTNMCVKGKSEGTLMSNSKSKSFIIVKSEKEAEKVRLSEFPIEETESQAFTMDNYDSLGEEPGYFHSQDNLNANMKSFIYGDFPCILCGKSYKTAGSLKNHRSLYHRDEISRSKFPSFSII